MTTPPQPGTRAFDPRIAAAALVLLGLGLRLWGITWSLPNREHFYSYHPDEIVVLAASHSAALWNGQLDPHFFNYGSLPVYLISLLRPLAYGLLAPSLYTDYLLGRLLTALFGAATVCVTWSIARRLGGDLAAGIAGFFMAIAPEHVIHSHYVTVDVPATFWVALCLRASLGIGDGAARRTGVRAAAWAGAAAGLAAGTKYNAGIVLLAPLAAIALRARAARDEAADEPRMPPAQPALAALGACVATFLLSTPGVLLWPGEFRRDFVYELGHTRTGHGLVFTDTPPAWIYHWSTNLAWGLGRPLLALVSLGLIAALVRLALRHADGADLRRGYLILLAFGLPYYAVIGAAQVKFQRYTLPLLPVLFVLLGCEAARLARGRDGEGDRVRRRPAAAGVGALVGIVGLVTLLYTVGCDGLFSQISPQDQAGAWLRFHAAGRSIGLKTAPWFYSPPVSPYNAGPQSKAAFLAHQADAPYRLLIVGADAGGLDIARPDYLALSEFETMDGLRLMRDPAAAAMPEVASFAAFLDAVNRRYRIVFRARNRPTPSPAGVAPRGEPPHDWLYPYPDESIYQRRD